MRPANNFHGLLQIRLGQRFEPFVGQAIAEASILTRLGLTVADVAWASADFVRVHGTETPFTQAPELCIEIASPSNSRKELPEKMAAYLEAGAKEAWIVFPRPSVSSSTVRPACSARLPSPSTSSTCSTKCGAGRRDARPVNCSRYSLLTPVLRTTSTHIFDSAAISRASALGALPTMMKPVDSSCFRTSGCCSVR